ncbi:bifunctional glycosyltransferase family 2/GtrA family protein [Microbispora sp. NEAU-D428]|uniref:bifunctional glycosyltransferase family 2/GtrA family protein n=1 Tax=Microbispora sitophila TaxID=2771537 RepID=UPI0018661A17|nr:bifunctional glycosyltransferase family 2/GtrA family protein [Microbispora sitophila]MBE3009730.1 bifunctional glycosyltransferase family 2/GtrA family protein [Microbispora sitophila]
MSMTMVAGPAAGASRRTRLVEVVVPVYNEERVLAASVGRLHAYLSGDFPYGFRVTIADNASTDGTWTIAQRLARELPEVRAVHLDQKGRGRALRRVWESSDADVVGYMDVDLSTDLDAFLPLIAPLMTGHSDLAIGTRLSPWSNVVRGPKREIISRSYNLLLRSLMGARFSDAQCGFKAARTEVVQALLPAVQDEAWFFDTELLLLAEQHGLRIHEVPVDWVDDPDSRVDIVRTAVDDLKGMWRVARGSLSAPAPSPSRTSVRTQIPTFALIGAISTVAHLALFWLLRSVLPPVAANAIALFVTAVANTAANRRFTFGVRGRAGALRHHLGGLVAFVAGLALTSGGLAALPGGASRAAELAAVIVANGLATLLRFLLLRSWVFAPRKDSR